MSNWLNRLREIKRLKERYGGLESPTVGGGVLGGAFTSSPPGSQAGGSGGAGGFPSPATSARDQAQISGFQRMSVITHATDRSSISSSSHD